ncbi:MAG TPA: tRNA (adenosine(37)-N6)-dimethylallyltransferase MiaA, partial [Sorangium sp.]|nr:tRNA (adenosine(37)-N6)-dimethylallyltransferase MiaA [Sorangium sp.]
FDARRFVTLADAAIADIRARGRTPVVCGGTFLWVKALLQGLAPAPPANPELRANHRRIVDEKGRPALHAMLAKVDPSSAARLAPNDFVRVSRALEVFQLSGKPISVWHAEHNFASARYRGRYVRVVRPREQLDARIQQRTLDWLERGWIQQVETMLSAGLGDCRAMKSVGFRQLVEHLRGGISDAELAPSIVRATRKFARRQRTWLRDVEVTWVAPNDDPHHV